MSKSKKKKELSLPPEDPKLKLKGSSRKPNFNIHGDINVGRDFIAGDQMNFTFDKTIQTHAEFLEVINELSKTLEIIKQSPITPSQKKHLLQVIKNINIIKAEAKKNQPSASVVTNNLYKSKETVDLISDNLRSIYPTREILSKLIPFAKKLFSERK